MIYLSIANRILEKYPHTAGSQPCTWSSGLFSTGNVGAQLANFNTFVDQQAALDINQVATSIAGESSEAFGRNHAVAGNEDRNRVAATGIAHGPLAAAQAICQCPVGHYLTDWNCLQRAPDTLLKIGSVEGNLQAGHLALAGEIVIQRGYHPPAFGVCRGPQGAARTEKLNSPDAPATQTNAQTAYR
jgi:hypothetical protein